MSETRKTASSVERLHMHDKQAEFMREFGTRFENDLREAISRAMVRFLENEIRRVLPYSLEGNLKGGTTIPAKWRSV